MAAGGNEGRIPVGGAQTYGRAAHLTAPGGVRRDLVGTLNLRSGSARAQSRASTEQMLFFLNRHPHEARLGGYLVDLGDEPETGQEIRRPSACSGSRTVVVDRHAPEVTSAPSPPPWYAHALRSTPAPLPSSACDSAR